MRNEGFGVRRIILSNFRIVDEVHDFNGSIIIENDIIKEIIADTTNVPDGDIVINGNAFNKSAVLIPAFIDLHAHFREPGFSEKETAFPSETVEAASLAAVAGGYATVICMANTNPVIDTLEKANALKIRAAALGLIDLYPVLSLTKNMEGKELSQIKELTTVGGVLMLSEDGKDLLDDNLFLAALGEAKRLGIPVSCHCDLGKAEETEAENNAIRRAIELGSKAGCHVHIAHVSTGEAADIIRRAKKNLPAENGFLLTCEATPHHIGATEEDARRMGEKSFGRVNPPLRTEADRQAIVAAINDGTIDAIATDHAPHRNTDKAAGAPGFSGLETAFAASLSNLPDIGLQRLSALLSANPARILGLRDRGGIAVGLRANLVIADTQARWKVEPEKFRSRGKCNPFTGSELQGKILMTFNAGKIVFNGDKNV
jgi:dihydroorotase